MSGYAFKLEGSVDQLANVVFGLILLAKLGGVLQGIRERHFRARRDELGDLIHVTQRQLQSTARIADSRSRTHRAESDDLCERHTG